MVGQLADAPDKKGNLVKIFSAILALLLVGATSVILWNVAVAQPEDSTIDVSHLQQASSPPEPTPAADPAGSSDPKPEAPAKPSPEKDEQDPKGKDEPANPAQDSAPKPQPAPAPVPEQVAPAPPVVVDDDGWDDGVDDDWDDDGGDD